MLGSSVVTMLWWTLTNVLTQLLVPRSSVTTAALPNVDTRAKYNLVVASFHCFIHVIHILIEFAYHYADSIIPLICVQPTQFDPLWMVVDGAMSLCH